MDAFCYRDGTCFCEDVSLVELAQRVGTPAYVYSRQTLVSHFEQFANAFKALNPVILYSVKSCGNIHLLRELVARGSGMDVVSGGELQRALLAGVHPNKIVFAGVGKSDEELRFALRSRIRFVNVESEEVLERLACELGVVQNVAVRLNPDVVDERTHRHTATGYRGSKFGIDFERVESTFERFGRSPHLRLRGLHFHLGSPIYSSEPYVRAIARVLTLVDTLSAKGFRIDALDIGGGFMADYGQHDSTAPMWGEYADPIAAALGPFIAAGGEVLVEPGRTISANAGILLTRVLFTKRSGEHLVAVVDTGMHHLLRPALYNAVQFLWPVVVDAAHVPHTRDVDAAGLDLAPWDIVGPICESTDRIASGRKVPPLRRGDLLSIFSCGAYGMVMASQYNAVPRPPEVLVDGSRFAIIRRRETYDDLFAAEIHPISYE